jgi:hypothetical protein
LKYYFKVKIIKKWINYLWIYHTNYFYSRDLVLSSSYDEIFFGRAKHTIKQLAKLRLGGKRSINNFTYDILLKFYLLFETKYTTIPVDNLSIKL